ncbi:MAG TPA: CheR family methyltransferase [Vicinamibacteria bacterium]|nr:CheR family methyltransferase [Vicinamibacteria bacterium]
MSSGPVTRESPRPAEAASDPVQDLEIRLLLQAVYERYGYDFRDYALHSQRRRVRQCLLDEGLPTVSALQDRVLHDPTSVERLVAALSVCVTGLFRHPGFYRAFRQRAAPILRTYPVVRVWHAGCATGEEVYSLAILLREEGLYERSQIYATDMNAAALRQAAAGTVAVSTLREAASCYMLAGGRLRLADYYALEGARASFDPALRTNVVFAEHNLVTDRSFNEFNVVICRNVLFYFNRPLQERVHALLYGSLARRGFLGLGHRETLRFTPCEDRYEVVDGADRLYRKIA